MNKIPPQIFWLILINVTYSRNILSLFGDYRDVIFIFGFIWISIIQLIFIPIRILEFLFIPYNNKLYIFFYLISLIILFTFQPIEIFLIISLSILVVFNHYNKLIKKTEDFVFDVTISPFNALYQNRRKIQLKFLLIICLLMGLSEWLIYKIKQ